MLRLAPDAANSYRDLAVDYVNLNRLDEAEAMYKEAESESWRHVGRAKSRYLLAFLKGDEAQMAQLASSVHGKAGRGRRYAGRAGGHGGLVREVEELT